MSIFRKYFYLLTLIFLVGCGGDSFNSKDDGTTPPDDTATTTIELSIDNTSIDVNNPAIISALVKTDNVAVDGIVVTFSSDLGVFTSEVPTALTKNGGVASITLTAGSIQGAGTVTATIASGETAFIGFETAGDGIDIGDPGEDDKLVTATISSTNISANSPATVTANVMGLEGPLAAQVITFSTDLGFLYPSSGTALTDGNGNAEILINADDIQGAGTVTATAASGEFAEVSFSSAGDGGLAAGKQIKLSLSNTDVSQSSPISVAVIVTDENGPVVGEVVNFSTTLGVFSPVSGTALTDAAGSASIVLTAGSVEGAGLITATITTGELDSIGFYTAGDASDVAGKSVSIEISNPSVTSASPATLTATVTDAGNPVAGEVVNFGATLGSLNPASGTALTNASGQAVITLTAGVTVGAGVATATLDNGATANVGFETAGDEIIDAGKTLGLSISTTDITEAGPATITVVVSDGNGPVVGEVVNFSTTLGVFSPASGTALTDGTGSATVVLTAGSVEGAGLVTATLTSGELDTIGFTTAGDASDVAGKSVSISISDTAVSASNPVTLTAIVTDAGNPVAGEVVNFGATLGSLNPASGTALTNASGQAVITLTAGVTVGAGVATATLDNGATANVGFETAGDEIINAGKTLALSISTTDITEASPATVTVVVSDGNGPVVGEVVNFSSTLGVFSPASGTALTDGTGSATVVLTAGSVEGAGLVTATLTSGELDTIGFNTAGDASQVEGKSVSISISDPAVSASNPVVLTAIVTEAGNPVAGEVVNFSATLGLLNPASGTALTDINGVATIALNAGSVAGAGVAVATLDNGATAKVGFETAGDDASVVHTISLTSDNIALDKLNPATLTATVVNGVTPVAGEVVTFTSTLGFFTPASGTALTDVNGDATIILNAGNVQGAGLVTASSVNGQMDTLGFETAGDQETEITVDVILVEPGTTNEITVINATTPGELIATVNGISSAVIVTFTSDIGEIPIPTAITDGSNQAKVDIYAGNELGAGTVIATLKDGETGETLLVVGATDLQMGGGDPFVEGEAQLSLDIISAGGTTVVSVDIVDENGVAYTLPVDVEFSSNCGIAGTSLLSSPITTANGSASSTYLAQGCVGDDPITVSANAGGINLTASAIINVLSADAGSLEFVSATPENISLIGVGGEESSTVVFRVLDTNGNPVSNTNVDFSLNTEVGGISLSPIAATSNNEGLVQTVVNSGSVATTVRVTASITGTSPLISSQSSLLVVSTGIPDQDSFTLFADILNPEGWDVFNSEISVTARMSDAFNNPVPDGTAVSFTTEGGTIEPSCVTVNGQCSVQWSSANPLPEGEELGGANVPEQNNSMGQKYGGRATIVATAIGEESFPDSNGNGRFDTTEMTAFAGTNISGELYDLPEAFVDHNEDGVFNPQIAGGEIGGDLETFTDFNADAIYDIADTKYNGSLCSVPAHAGCASEKSLNVRGELVIIMSGSNAFLTVDKTIDADDDIYNEDDLVVNITGENTGAASVIIADLHNQPMPAGTVVEFTATAGSIVGPDSFVWPNDNHNGGRTFSVSIEGEDEPKSGSLIVEITTPSGANTTIAPISIVIGAAVVIP